MGLKEVLSVGEAKGSKTWLNKGEAKRKEAKRKEALAFGEAKRLLWVDLCETQGRKPKGGSRIV